MSEHTVHDSHDHVHGAGCGHTAVQHEGHTDYLHNGHLHNAHQGHVDEHTISSSAQNPTECNSGHECTSHAGDHQHDAGCGHEQVPHANHVDYLVEGHLHNQHGDHCDDHGQVASA
ncbi:MAG: hypothetical protein ACXVAO_05990 [Vulcanimicrobiaceae bacterium]